MYTLPETNILPVKTKGWKMNFLLGWSIMSIFRGYVSFREGISELSWAILDSGTPGSFGV